MLRLPRFRLPLLPLFVLALPLVRAHATPDTWSVNVGGTGDFVEVQQAVQHAQPGDTILVWGPANGHREFRRVTITKGLTIVGIAPERVRLDGLTVRDVPAGQSVTLVNLSVGEFFSFPFTLAFDSQHRAEGALVEDCAGPVVFNGCLLQGGYAGPGGPGMRAVRSDVALLDCEIGGGWGGDAGTSSTGMPNAQHALVLEDSRALVSGSRLQGGGGIYAEVAEDEIGGTGGDGVRANGESFLWLLDSSVLGGTGDEVLGMFSVSIGGDGGAGVRLGQVAQGFARATAIEGGAGGNGTTAPGQDGQDVIGALAIGAGAAFGLDAPLWVRDVDLVHATVRGEPGTNAFLRIGEASGFRALGSTGVLVADGAISIPLGALPPSGETTVPIPLPALPNGGSQLLVIQSVLEEPAGAALGEARALVVLDARWLPAGVQRYHVDAAAPPGGDGRTWGSAFSDLRTALEAATGIGPEFTDVWVREGIYRPVPEASTPIEPFFVKSRTRVYGSFAGTETELVQRDAANHPTVLSGDLLGNDTPSDASRDDNSRIVLAVGPWEPRTDVRLDGLTVRSGHNGLIWGYIIALYGASGVEIRGSADVVGCTFIDNRFSTSLRLSCDGDVRVVGCRFLGNDSRGYDLWSNGACHVTPAGAGGRALFADCDFSGNAGKSGGGIYTTLETRIVNCTFYGNFAQLRGGAVFGDYGGPEIAIENSLFWRNLAPQSPDIGHGYLPTPIRVDSSLFRGASTSPWGVGNVEGPPHLVDPVGADGVLGTLDDDLTPGEGSPAVDAGNNAFLPPDELDVDADGDVLEPLPLDAAGMPRRADDPNVPDTGSGTPPIVDMGSRERHP